MIVRFLRVSMQRFLRNDFLFSLFLTIFLVLAIIGRYLYFKPPELIPLLLVFVFWASLVLGYRSNIEVPKAIYMIIVFFASLSFIQFSLLSFGFIFILLLILFSLTETGYLQKYEKKFGYLFFIAGFSIIIFGFYRLGIPILSPENRYGSMWIFSTGAMVFFVFSIALVKDLKIFIGSLFLILVSTFRSSSFILLLTYFFSKKLNKKRVIGLVIGSFLILLVGNYVALETRGWDFTVLKLILNRSGFTYGVYQDLVQTSLPFGRFHGELILSNNPGILISNLYDYLNPGQSYTSFFFGQPVADFGIFGSLECFLYGLLLKKIEYVKRFKAIGISFSIVIIEIGITGLPLGVLAFCSYLVKIQNEKKEENT